MRFDKHGVLQIRAPKLMLASQINYFIEKNSSWIQKQVQKREKQAAEKKYYLFGEECNLDSYDLEDLEKYYKSAAKKYIVPRAYELAGKYGFSFTGIRITSASSRWGSCSSKKTINFSYRLVMAPKDCIDYVIIHELCHLRQMNHSHKFWSEVAAIMPGYKQQEKHLKQYSWRYEL